MVSYLWPPLPEKDPKKLREKVLAALSGAWQNALDEQDAILALRDTAPRVPYYRALERVKRFQGSIKAFQDEVDAQADDFLDMIAGEYARGAKHAAKCVGIGQVVWGNMNEYVFQSLASDSYADLLKMSETAGKTSREFAKIVRSQAAQTLWAAGTNETAVQAGRRFWKKLEENRIAVVIYRDGSRHQVADYAGMVARTKAKTAFNYGSLDVAESEDVQYMEVVDGANCGWDSHNSLDFADGSIRTLAECREYPLSHPNCKRSFIPVSRTLRREIRDAVRAEMEGDEDYEPALTIPALERFKQRKERLGIGQ
ncbi:hypothetical protein HMPREF0388_1740 [Mobiluncus curtisii ATCC 51333]|uniref:Phage minor capsid protein 2 n=2 Tax=Mobiluncus curtisii TaxID=2051 RepID=E6M107_9ACTO|nr:hypothetical protein HMPREF0388_1740 [Mobiluncus curtisii ATCC 51333]